MHWLDLAGLLKILEVGAGAGAMIERFLRWEMFDEADYTALDLQPENIAAAAKCLLEWAGSNGYAVEKSLRGPLLLTSSRRRLQLQLEAIDLFDFMAREDGRRRWDLLTAHAFLDLMDIPAVLPKLFRLAQPGGLFYFTLNFDGETIFEPALDPGFDEQVIRLYHCTMDERLIDGKPSGDSCSGRHLFGHLKTAGAETLCAGASDWVVFPTGGVYPQAEALFLAFHHPYDPYCAGRARRAGRPALQALDRRPPSPNRTRRAGLHRPSAGFLWSCPECGPGCRVSAWGCQPGKLRIGTAAGAGRHAARWPVRRILFSIRGVSILWQRRRTGWSARTAGAAFTEPSSTFAPTGISTICVPMQPFAPPQPLRVPSAPCPDWSAVGARRWRTARPASCRRRALAPGIVIPAARRIWLASRSAPNRCLPIGTAF